MQKTERKYPLDLAFRILLGLFGCSLLALIYLFQRINFATYVVPSLTTDSYWPFIVNKVGRLVLNDLACMVLVFALFRKKQYLQVAFYLFLVELFILMPIYLSLKLSLEGPSEISSPLLSQFHRLIVNPTLMILLIIGFFYQRMQEQKQ